MTADSMLRRVSLMIAATGVSAAAPVQTRITVTLPSGLARHASGRLLVFVRPAMLAGGDAAMVDLDADGVSVASQDIADFGRGRAVVIDAGKRAYPTSFATLSAGDYRVQVVLDRDGNYNYRGRGPGDLVSQVTTVHFPLSSSPTIPLDHELPVDPGQFDVTGLPPKAAEQIL
ncbi:MAG: enterochelin esterase, partial [Oxalobacteraceae bacterium]